MTDPCWSLEVLRWANEHSNRPRLCARCGGLGKRKSLIRRIWRECRACGGTGGDIHDERAWWNR